MNIPSFETCFWMTPFQLRDVFLFGGPSTDWIKAVRDAANVEQARRKGLPGQFCECPRCKGWHDQKQNQDGLCEKCEQIVHLIGWDEKLSNENSKNT